MLYHNSNPITYSVELEESIDITRCMCYTIANVTEL